MWGRSTSACSGVVWDVNKGLPRVMPVTADPKLVPTVNAANPSKDINGNDTTSYYPNIDMGGGHFGTRCTTNCATVNKCASGQGANCMVTVLDHYTSSFNWAQTNGASRGRFSCRMERCCRMTNARWPSQSRKGKN